MFSLLCLLATSAYAEHFHYSDIDTLTTAPLGERVHFLVEHGERLSLEQAIEASRQDQFQASRQQVPAFGVGPEPVWVRLAVHNSQENKQTRCLIVDAAWLDDIQVFVQHKQQGTVQQFHTGDKHSFSTRPIESRVFHFDVELLPGQSQVFVRVETEDPMVIPLYLLTKSDEEQRLLKHQYAYGFGYGFLIALLSYNFMLFLGLADFRYFLYVIYLGTFSILNFHYTGHGFAWLWPESIFWQQWSLPLLITFFAASGLTFALYFLDTRSYAKRLYKGINLFILSAVTAVLVLFVLRFQSATFLTSFVFLSFYLVLMLVLGGLGLKNNQPSARYFLIAMIAGLLGVATTMLASWGFIRFNTFTFNAAQIGTLVEAVLLAFALSYRVRHVEQQRNRAETMAHIDLLTGISNRRSFYQKTSPLWDLAKRHDRALSVIMFDIDNFKDINDKYGHRIGDEVLKGAGKMITRMKRRTDIAARWGGEEFILLLAESGIDDANAFAERLRIELSKLKTYTENEVIFCTASFGVAERQGDDMSIDSVIEKSDKALYEAKVNGKDQVINFSSRFASAY